MRNILWIALFVNSPFKRIKILKYLFELDQPFLYIAILDSKKMLRNEKKKSSNLG